MIRVPPGQSERILNPISVILTARRHHARAVTRARGEREGTSRMPETPGESLHDAHRGGQVSHEARSSSALTPNIRRHLGGALRAAYAASPAEPPGERITGLLNRLGKARPDGATD